MDEKIRWGILGPGNISHKFATGFNVVENSELYAVGSRDIGRANTFGDEYNIPIRYGSYHELVSDPDVDAIYIATPHSFHKEHAMLCLSKGKAVLCEKPFSINATEAKEMVKCASENNVFLMEAMWTRFLPIYSQIQEWIKEGSIGDIRMITADFGFRTTFNPEGRLFRPELGGGALLDVGIYTISLVSFILGGKSPSRISSMANLGKSGVDEQSAMILGYEDGEMAILYTAINTNTKQEAVILGEKGSISIPSFWNATSAILKVDGEKEHIVEMSHKANGYCYEAEEVNRCLREGKIESHRMSWSESISIMETMDEIRRQWGLKYPME
ncbi:MAG: Gfo/Idh/MocA family oxidoreductase [Clostridiales bacterium]|nr:Gfo/Idh/MocA family oxidoreductase [Clostridiales bacterium]